MREILFRGKRTDNDEWAEGLPSYDIDGNLKEIEVYRGFCDCNIFEVDPGTICQYTGFTDNTKWEALSEDEKQEFLSEWNCKENRKNTKEDWDGRKIFENDIIECKRNNQHFQSQIEWDPTCGGFMIQDTKQGSAVGLDAILSCGIYNDFKLIGNIFDNPEFQGGGSRRV